MATLDDLLALLDLEALEVNLFRGESTDNQGSGRVFGGQVAAQALVAATRTVDPAASGEVPVVHSLHAYFLRPGDPEVPIVFDVDRIRDGRSFTTRRVVAIQHGRAIFNLQASFQLREEGKSHSQPMPDVRGPDESFDYEDVQRRLIPDLPQYPARPLELRWTRADYLGEQITGHGGPPGPPLGTWWRAVGELGDDQNLHAAIAAYASDMFVIDASMLPHGMVWQLGNVMSASLDHAMWFHRSFRVDDWIYYEQRSPAADHSRGLTIGEMWRPDGQVAITVVQEGLMRPQHPPRPPHLRGAVDPGSPAPRPRDAG